MDSEKLSDEPNIHKLCIPDKIKHLLSSGLWPSRFDKKWGVNITEDYNNETGPLDAVFELHPNPKETTFVAFAPPFVPLSNFLKAPSWNEIAEQMR